MTKKTAPKSGERPAPFASPANLIAFGVGSVTAVLGAAALIALHTAPGGVVGMLAQFGPKASGTAVALLCSGIGLALLASGVRKASLALGILPAVIGSASLLEAVFGIRLGVLALEQTAPACAICSVLCGLALVSMAARPGWVLTPGILGTIASSLGAAVLFYYATGKTAIFRWNPLTYMSVSSAIGFSLLGFGILARAWRQGAGDRNSTLRWAPVLVAGASMTVSLYLWQGLHGQETAVMQRAIHDAAAHVASDLESEIVSRALAADRLGRQPAGLRESAAAREFAAEAAIAHYTGFRSIEWLDSSLRPPRARDHPGLLPKDVLAAARADGKPAAITTVEPGGESLLYVVTAVFHDGAPEGWLVAAFDLPRIIASTLEDDEDLSGLGVAILAGPGEVYTRNLERGQYAEWAQQGADALGLQITVCAWPATDWLARSEAALDYVVLIGGSLMGGLLALTVHLARKSHLRSRDLEAANAELRRTIGERELAEAGLKRSEQRFRTSVDNIPDGFGIFSAVRDSSGSIRDFVFEYVNDAGCAIEGQSREELIGKRLLDVAPVQPDASLFEEYCAVTETGVALRREISTFTNTDPQQLERAFDVRAAKLGDGFVAAWLDVTERRRAEEDRRQSDARFRALYEDVPVALYRSTPSGELVHANPAALRLLGLPDLESLQRRNVSEFYVDAGYRGRALAILEREGVLLGYEMQLRRHDGEVIWVRDTMRAVRDRADRLLYCDGVLEDITGRRRAIEQLQASEERYRDLFENAHDIVYTMDLEGNILSANHAAERITGYSRREALGMNLFGMIAPEFRESARQFITRKLGGDEHTAVELEIELSDGRRVCLDTSMRLQFSRGNPVAIQAIARDVTERIAAQRLLAAQAKELARSNAELEQFAYVASHDLQEPLRMVTSYAQLIAERYRGKLDADADEFIGYMLGGTTRMRQFILDLLAYSRVSRRGHELQPTRSTEVLETALLNLKTRIEESGAVVSCGPLPPVMADSMQLGQLFQNLVGNALKFHGSASPRIEIRAEPRGAEWLFSVHDNGVGVEPAERERIFGLFERGARSTRSHTGTGIGLAICKRIVERHGGRIWVEPEPGGGSIFCFTLMAATGCDPEDPSAVCRASQAQG